jgi:hypothetical protein
VQPHAVDGGAAIRRPGRSTSHLPSTT